MMRTDSDGVTTLIVGCIYVAFLERLSAHCKYGEALIGLRGHVSRSRTDHCSDVLRFS